MKTILVTGGAGFIGSNFIKVMLAKYPRLRIINVDALTYAGNLANVEEVEANRNYTFIQADIRNRQQIQAIFDSFQIDAVVHCAAETHVDRSIDGPEVFLTTNVVGTQVMLDTALQQWKVNSGDKYSREFRRGVKFVHISTDEVYGALGDTGYFDEIMPLLPNSPYAASKAGADLVVRAYNRTYGLPINITRCSNNYGPGQYPEKLIPLMIRNCIQGKELPVYGDGMQVRDWLHVMDHCRAIDVVLQKGVDGEVYNIGGNNEWSNIEIVRLIIQALGKSENLIRYVHDRPGHDRRYAIDNTKIRTTLNWQPVYVFEQGIQETIDWYVSHGDWTCEVAGND